ncbi:hypothetical protein ACQKMD_19460 [Viridibacillus sp. NPDC096237]|uniref:hypothetical protein n=1 Tax=Viridibacillus sp. NPDC096237 TaxID=3390721 RepID=UPI003CFCDFB6
MEENKQIIQDESSKFNSDDDSIFNPMRSDNQIMGSPSHKKMHLQQQPKGIRLIGYTLIGFLLLIVVFSIVARFL